MSQKELSLGLHNTRRPLGKGAKPKVGLKIRVSCNEVVEVFPFSLIGHMEIFSNILT